MKSLLLMLACAAGCVAHTITFTGVATEFDTAYGVQLSGAPSDWYFGITQVGGMFGGMVSFTDSAWDGNGALAFFVEAVGVAPYDEFDGGHGVVNAALVGPRWANFFFSADFNGAGELRDFSIVSATGTHGEVGWSQGVGSFFNGMPAAGFTLSKGYLTGVEFDGSTAKVDPLPEPGTWILVGSMFLVVVALRLRK